MRPPAPATISRMSGIGVSPCAGGIARANCDEKAGASAGFPQSFRKETEHMRTVEVRRIALEIFVSGALDQPDIFRRRRAIEHRAGFIGRGAIVAHAAEHEY